MTKKELLLVEVKPDVLKWAINSSGWKPEEVSKKLQINPNVLNSWLSGEAKPNIKQLDEFAFIVKRPLAAFFLKEPPQEKPAPKDYRMLPGKEGKFDKKTILAIRRARKLQKISKELSDNINTNLAKLTKTVNSSEDPKIIAEKFRAEFKFYEALQRKFKTSYDLFNFLRDIIEDRNIIVFQISMPIEDARGFTLVDDSPAIIVVNSKDQIEARIFTLMHEFGHVLLNESGVSMPENALFIKNVAGVEKWCNDFSSAFLLPELLAKKEFTSNKKELIETKTLNSLSRAYKVSKAMLLYNMSKLGYISQNEYNSVIERFKPEVLKPKAKEKKKGFGKNPADKKCVSEKGQKFVSLVSHNVDKGFITHSEALDYLSIKSKNLDKVMSKAKK